jgi:hypothetical protein
MLTCALTTGTDVPLTQNKTAKSNISFFFITFLFSDESQREQAKKLFVRVRDLMRTNRSPLFEIALVLVRFDHVAHCIVNANHGVM